MKRAILFILVGMIAGLTNCSTDMKVCVKEVSAATIAALPVDRLNADIARINTYTSTLSGVTVIEDRTGLRYSVTSAPAGESPCLSSVVTVNYSGRVLLSDNTKLASAPFDAQQGVSFSLSNLILGWQIALPKFAPGSTLTLYIPSGMAYGTTARTNIPANSVLVFDITLVSFE